MKPLDEFVKQYEEDELKKAAEEKKMKPFLDKQLWKIYLLDKKIKRLEEEKQKELMKMSDLLEMSTSIKHKLPNGYLVRPDNRYKVNVKDISKFLSWLKRNKTPVQVLDFFDDALKKANLKRFCEQEFNRQEAEGEMKPSIDGVEFGEMTYRKLTTVFKED